VSTVHAATPEELATAARGLLIAPGDPTYDEARALYNGMIDKRPALIARCADVADVINAVNYARERKMKLAVRGGGHNGAGLGSVDDGLVIDLSPMRGIRVDPDARTALVQGGATWGDVDHATHAFGMATPCGIISTTGVGGLTLGGGIGHLSRRCGLSIDNVIEADVVLADGRLARASETENPDLYWAIRGGGGNFGVVTSFTFRLHPVDMVLAGPTFWPLERIEEAMQFYDGFIADAPEELNGFFATLTVPPADPFPPELQMKKVCGVVWCWTGSPEADEEVFAPVRAMEPLLDGIEPMPFPALNSAFDPLFPPGQQWYWRADFVNELPREAIAVHAEMAAKLPSWQSTMHLYPIDGAVHRAKTEDTAFAYRESRWASVIVGVDADPAMAGKLRDWCVEYWEKQHPYTAGGAYVNFLGEGEGQDRVRATYGPNYDRLAKVKGQYDPENLFRVNQNIQPA
jgi:UDP-N-acetylenolpyruvoylglucosamine reductase